MRRIAKAIGIMVLLGIVALWLAPWHSVAERRLIAFLEASGYRQVQLRVTQIGITSSLQDISFTTGDITVSSKEATAQLVPGDKDWKWNWQAKPITITGLPVFVPETTISGTTALSNGTVITQGKWGSADGTFKALFRVDYPLSDPQQAKIALAHFSMPWGGGKIVLENAVIPLSGQAYTLTVLVKAVSLDALLQPLTGNRATATGTVSGSLPLMIRAGAMPLPMAGLLKAENPGKIVMQPEAIPGDNAQIDLLRDVMKDFHYQTLSASMNKDKNNKLSLTLALTGNNPAVAEGRAVKLNVHLEGDVLDFVKQSMAASDPQAMLKQGNHEK